MSRGHRSRSVLACALLALAGLYLAWFRGDPHLPAVLLVFVAPPLLLAVAVLRGRRAAVFWSGVIALGWFSHGVMVAWSRPPERLYAWIAIALSVLAIVASSWAGLRARFGPKP